MIHFKSSEIIHKLHVKRFLFVILILVCSESAVAHTTTICDPNSRMDQIEARLKQIQKMDLSGHDQTQKELLKLEILEYKKEINARGMRSRKPVRALVLLALIVVLIVVLV